MQRLAAELDTTILPRPFFLITTELDGNPPSKTYKCDSCDLSFQSFFALKIHKYSDQESSSLLSSGVSLKTPTSPISAPTKCSFNQILGQEEIIKTNKIEAFQCTECKKEFKNSKGLQQHVGKVHDLDNKQAHCHICLKKFRHKHAVKFHISQVHEKTTRISCEYCKKTLYNKYLLEDHAIRCPMKTELYQ
ncbi:unnamed protein product [Blepharisma stoltei]|uniref:C2H2-type domain-containing protein n=1 Tax=Blepharisma stoltei TaxID=1481888 RepID=A0AAU9ISV6_9CILI|nr:unnamed protein product [Blepharisma stoltei]